MAQGKVEICGVNTAKLPILNEEEKEALFVRIKEGDREAKEEYIKGNLRLVLSVIRRFGASGENPKRNKSRIKNSVEERYGMDRKVMV